MWWWLACAATPPADTAAEPACPAWGAGEVTGHLADPALDELSGVVAGGGGRLWAIEDSGNPAALYALDTGGAALGAVTVDGAAQDDWEAIAYGEHDGQPALIIADIGDNALERASITFLIVAEPDPDAASAAAAAAPARYPDGPHDAETALFDPRTGDVYVLTKVLDGASDLYRYPAPLTPGVEVTLDHVLTLSFAEAPLGDAPATTAGDVSPDGALVVVRTYPTYFAWTRGPDATIAEALAAPPCASGEAGALGEAIAFLGDGRSLVTIPEGVGAEVRVFAGGRR